MNTKHFLTAILLALSISCISFADRQLDRGEILQIFEKLTSQPRKTWISAGDDRVREEHMSIDGESVPLDGKFSNGLDGPSEPMCRCVLVFGTR